MSEAKVWKAENGKWTGNWADGTPLRHLDKCGIEETRSYFDSREEVMEAIREGGEYVHPASGLVNLGSTIR